jgi:hypothetical protein
MRNSKITEKDSSSQYVSSSMVSSFGSNEEKANQQISSNPYQDDLEVGKGLLPQPK